MRAASIPQVVALLGVVLSSAALADATQCLKYDPATVTLSGTLIRMTHAGPPNYENLALGDKPEIYFHLRLPKPICTIGASDGANGGLEGVTEVQLILSASDYTELRPMLGRIVTLSGKLTAAVTGHHYSPLLLDSVRLLLPNPSLERP